MEFTEGGIFTGITDMHLEMYKNDKFKDITDEIGAYQTHLMDLSTFWPWLKSNAKIKDQTYIENKTRDYSKYMGLLKSNVLPNIKHRKYRITKLEIAENLMNQLLNEYEPGEGAKRKPKPGKIITPYMLMIHILGDNYMGAYFHYHLSIGKMSFDQIKDDYSQYLENFEDLTGYDGVTEEFKKVDRRWVVRPMLTWILGEKYHGEVEKTLLDDVIEKDDPDIFYQGHFLFDVDKVMETISKKVNHDMHGSTKKENKIYPRRLSYFHLVKDLFALQPDVNELERRFKKTRPFSNRFIV